MVRDSTHRPRSTQELLALGADLMAQSETSKLTAASNTNATNWAKTIDACDKDSARNTSALQNNSQDDDQADDDEEDEDDEDTIVQRNRSLDEEIQDTIIELQRNSLTLQKLDSSRQDDHHNSDEVAEAKDQFQDCIGSSTFPEAKFKNREISEAKNNRSNSPSSHRGNSSTVSAICTTTIPSPISNSTIQQTTTPIDEFYQQYPLYQQQHHQYSLNLAAADQHPASSCTNHSISSKVSSCLSAIEARSTRNKSKAIDEFGIPTVNKDRPLFSESIQHMQRWRNFQTKSNRDGEAGVSFPKGKGGYDRSSFDLGFGNYSTKGNIDGMSSSSSFTKLPRPRSWVNNLLHVGSSSSPRQRHHSFDIHLPGSPSKFQRGADLLPVSSLVLQDEFQKPATWNTNPRDAPQRLINLGQRDYYDDADEEENEEAIIRYPKKSMGNLKAATQSTPNLTSSPSSSTFSNRKPVPSLLVRNLDDAPRGSFTPSIPAASNAAFAMKKKMTNPWNRLSQGDSLRNRNDLIDADEEEMMMDEAVTRERNNGTMAEEERAVLDMLDQMNDNVDTFDKPTMSRAATTVTRSKLNLMEQEKGMPPIPNFSPTRLSVKAFASAIDRGDSPSRSSSPIRGDSFLNRTSSTQGSNLDSQGGIKKAIEEREKLDLDIKGVVGSLAGSIGTVLRKKSSFGNFLSGGFLSSGSAVDSDAESKMLESLEPVLLGSPQKRDFFRQDSTSTNGSSYASQTNAFLNRRPTHAADKHLTHSPSQSVSSSGHGSNVTYWSKPGYATESPFTSPDLASAEKGKQSTTSHGFYKIGDSATTQAPLMRRMMTDQTEATSISSLDMAYSPAKDSSTMLDRVSSSSPTRSNSILSSSEVKNNSKAALFETPTKATTRAGSSKSNISPNSRYTSGSPTRLSPSRHLFANNVEVNNAEESVSPSQLGTPKRAKDLIRFYEQNSAPSSPQLISPRTNTKTRPKWPAVQSTLAPLSSNLFDSDAIHEKIGVQAAAARRSFRGRALVGITADEGGEDVRRMEEVTPSDEEENMTMMPTRGRSTRISTFLAGNYLQDFEDATAESIEPLDVEGANIESKQESPTWKKSGQRSFKNGLSRLASALTPGMSRANTLGSSADDRRQNLDSFSLPNPHLSRAPTRKADTLADDDNDNVHSELDDIQRSLSTRSTGTSRSFRQRTEAGKHLRLDTEASIDMMGQPGATPIKTGFLYYFNVHANPPIWQWAQAVLLPSAIALSWMPVGGGRTSIVLDLSACREVHSVLGPDRAANSTKDDGTRVAREQGLNRLCPWQFIFEDGIERMAVESAKDRVQWVSAIRESLSSTADLRELIDGGTVSASIVAEEASLVEPQELHSTTIGTPSRAPPNFNIQLSDAPVGGTIQSESEINEIDRIRSIWRSEQSTDRSQEIHSLLDEVPPPVPPKQDSKRKRFVDENPAPILVATQSSKKPSVVATNTDQIRSIPIVLEGQSTTNQKAVGNHNTLVSSFTKSNASSGLEQGEEYGPRTPRSRAMFGWIDNDDREILPGDSVSQRPARSETSSSRYTAIVRPSIMKPKETLTNKTASQSIRDNVMANANVGDSNTGLHTLVEETASQAGVSVLSRHSINVGPSEVPATVASTKPLAPKLNLLVDQNIQTPAIIDDRATRDNDLAVVLNAIKENERNRQEQQKQQEDIGRYLNELNSWLEKDVVDRSKEWRTLALGVTQLHEELNAIKTNNAVKAVDAANGTVAGLSASNAALLGNVVSGAASAALATGGVLGYSAVAATQAGGSTPAQIIAGGPSGPRAMPGGCNDFNPMTPLQPALESGVMSGQPANVGPLQPIYGNDTMAATPMQAMPMQASTGQFGVPRAEESLQALALGVNAPAPISSPAPSPSIKRSGTRTWRAEASPAPIRNDVIWSRSGTVKNKKDYKEEKKAEGRARRRSALTDSNLGRLAVAAGGAALVAAATHEYEKYKEKQRSEGKPEEASQDVDEKTGTFVHHQDVPEVHIEKIKEAVKEKDEGKVREAIKGAAEVGAGTAAIRKLMDWIKGGNVDGKEDQIEDDSSTATPLSTRLSDGTTKGNVKDKSTTAASIGSRTAKSSGSSFASTDASDALREAVESMSSIGGGGALALAVEEILKHLLEKKEEDKRRAKEEAEAEAVREAKRKAEEEIREQRLLALREAEKNELVEAILSKLQQEKAIQEASAAAKQKEMDPKTAIESLVSAINQQRATEAAQQANADAAIRQMAADLVKTTSEQNGKMVEAVHGAAREMLRHNVESHAEELKRILSKEVSSMFEDVGKIREAKRALEHEIADLFSIKSRHLGDVAHSNAPPPALQPAVTLHPVEASGSQKGAPSNASVKSLPQQPVSAGWGQQLPPMPIPQAMPMPMPAQMGMGGMLMPTPPPKRDLVGPFSVSFGPRKK